MISANNIIKTYYIKENKFLFLKKNKTIKRALNDVSIRVKRGEIVGLLGVNGAGKTTMIKILSTMLEPTSGTIFIDGIDAIKYPMDVKYHINLITSGERNIYWRLTGRENLEYFGRLYGMTEKKLKIRIKKILKLVDLTDSADLPVEKYSKGMKQRLQIARGIINDPTYLFLDEPTLGLDIVISKEMRKYIKKLACEEKKGILLTTHYIHEAEELCDYVYIIHNGEIISHGNTVSLINQYNKKYRSEIEVESINEKCIEELKLLVDDCTNIYFDKLTNIIHIESGNEINVDVINIINNCNCKIKTLKTLNPSLEDVILKIIGDKNA